MANSIGPTISVSSDLPSATFVRNVPHCNRRITICSCLAWGSQESRIGRFISSGRWRPTQAQMTPRVIWACSAPGTAD
jgi:hypothetical protein